MLSPTVLEKESYIFLLEYFFFLNRNLAKEMEALASYGSDSEDDEACSSSAPHVIATTTASSAPSSDAASSAAAFATASAAVTAPPVAALRFDARVPPRPAGGCDAATQERVVALREREGNFTDTLRRNKKFGNPYLLRQVVEHFKIDETGSNFVAPAASGSSGSGSARFAPECFVDHLRKLRAAAVAGASLPQRQPKPQPQLQLQRPTSGAVAAAAASAGVLPPPSNAPPRKRSRKSRWS